MNYAKPPADRPRSASGSSIQPTALSRLNADARAEYWASLALRNSKGLGPRGLRRLLEHYGSAYEAFQQVEHWGEAGAGIRSDVARTVASGAWRAKARPEWESSRDLDGHIILWTSPLYPDHLRELPDAPVLLYARGDLSLLRKACVGIVGSRACSREKSALTAAIAEELSADGITVVSGLARGIDGAAHRAALERSGSSIAVLGAGLDVVYPPEHLDLYREMGLRGLLLSEFAPGTLPDGRHFPIRNRIISGLSLGVLVVEGAIRSGSLVTARLALEQNRAVYAVPPQMDQAESEGTPSEAGGSDGCALLLEQGAKPCLKASDILLDLLPLLEHAATNGKRPVPPKGKAKTLPLPLVPRKKGKSDGPAGSDAENERSEKELPKDLSPLERQIVLELAAAGPLPADELALRLPPELESGALSAQLLMLEVRGLLRRLPGSLYEVSHA